MGLNLILVLFFQNPMGVFGELGPEFRGTEYAFSVQHSLAKLDDLDGDGAPEVVIAAYNSTPNGPGSGGLFVLSGRQLSLSQTIPGLGPGSFMGWAVAGVGDLDGDGLSDIIGTASNEPVNGAGVVHAYSSVTGLELMAYYANPVDGFWGYTLDGLDDIDSDGVRDLLIGVTNSPRFFPAGGGAVAVSGRTGQELYLVRDPAVYQGVVKTLADYDGDGIRDFLQGYNTGVVLHSGKDGSVIRSHDAPRHDEGFGHSTISTSALLGDLNSDGLPEYAIGADGDHRHGIGHVYVYDGATGALLMEIPGLSGRGSAFGWSVADAGDVDGDGYSDILVGDPNWHHVFQRDPGAVYVFSGLDGRFLARLHGDLLHSSWVGATVLGMGDIDGDGLDDFLAGSNSSVNGIPGAGVWRTYGLHSYLNISPRTVSAAAGGTLHFSLDFPDDEAGRSYLILASGDLPGRTLFGGVHLPIPRTPLFDLMGRRPPSWFPGSQGVLNAHGDAAVDAILPPGAASAWAGRTLRFTAVTLSSPHDAGNYSAGIRVTIEN